MTTKTPCYGASANDWLTLDAWHGLTADLLPVVSNPKAVVSGLSKMKDKGKVPSRYNRQGEVAGFPEWTRYKAAADDIERWKKQADYGICIQTRHVRALDIDVPDVPLATEIAEFILDSLEVQLPLRYRTNSAKFLLAVRIEGEMPKRVIKVREKVVPLVDGDIAEPAWLIEFLANGQQFIAAGTHGSGARIKWADCGDGMPDNFPTITVEQFEKLWAALEKRFAREPSTLGSIRKRGEHFESDDVNANKLDAAGLVLGEGNDGQLFIDCPWKGDHSGDSGITECAYFPRGSGGYDLGHFKCMHAGCANHSDTDFEEALGLRDDMFEQLPELSEEEKYGALTPTLPRDLAVNKDGVALATVGNLKTILMRPELCGDRICFDAFKDEIVWCPVEEPGQWRPLKDTDYTRLRIYLESTGFLPIGKEMMRDVIEHVAHLNPFDTAVEWLTNLQWDGTPRVDNFLRDYFSAADDAYTRAVALYMWTAMAGRVLDGGCKADMVPVLVGKQGVGKSLGINRMVVAPEHTTSINLMTRDDDLSRRMRGKLVIEIGELRGLHSRDMESIKEFITKTHEMWTPKYKEFDTSFPRRCVFIGTTNQEDFLADTTGNRRWLPVGVGKVATAAIERDRLQLWAEAAALYQSGGIAYKGVETDAARAVQEHHRMGDVWHDIIDAWLHLDDIDGSTPASRGFVSSASIMADGLNIDSKNIKRGDEMKVASIMRELGYHKARPKINGRDVRGWSNQRIAE